MNKPDVKKKQLAQLWARQGVLVAVVPPGRKNAIGVTRDSVMRLVSSSNK